MSLRPLTVYRIFCVGTAFLTSLIFTVDMIFQVRVVGMTPLQLALMGTILEVSVFVFEVPTGMLADLRGRKPSTLVGLGIMGGAFMLEGLAPVLWAVSVAQALWGLGYTFISGAVEAWIADEVGQDAAGDAFLGGTQATHLGALLAGPLSIAISLLDDGGVATPIWLGGAGFLVLCGVMAVTMRETRFKPQPRAGRSTWAMLKTGANDAKALIGRQPIVLGILGIGLLVGLHSEGYDRLWTAHLLQDYGTGWFSSLDPVIPLGILRGVSLALTAMIAGAVRKRITQASSALLGRVQVLMTALLVACIACFALVRQIELALALFVPIYILRHLMSPLQTAWLNLRIDDSSVRATLFSVSSQVDAVGQIAGGPLAGAVGNVAIRAALGLSAGLLIPALPLYRWIIRQEVSSFPRQAGL